MTEPQAKGFFGALFDLSFQELITTKMIKLLYIIGIVIAGLSAATLLVSGLWQGGSGLVALIVAPLTFFLGVISLRIWLELVMVVFKIADNTEILAKKKSSE